MPSAGREVAKFLSGIAFNETLGHWWLGVWSRGLLPWDLGFFTFTDKMNHVCMAVWPLLFIGLVWVGWIKKPNA